MLEQCEIRARSLSPDDEAQLQWSVAVRQCNPGKSAVLIAASGQQSCLSDTTWDRAGFFIQPALPARRNLSENDCLQL
jgi:hypothetical protein